MHPRERSRLALLATAASICFLVLPPTTFLAAFAFTAIALRAGARAGKSKCDDPKVTRILEELCEKAELPTPEVWCNESTEVWATARGIRPKKRKLVVSDGARALPDEELEAVLAHELGHYAAWDTLDALIWLPAILAAFRGGAAGAEWVYRELHHVAEAPLPSNLAVATALIPAALLLLAVLATNRWSEERADAYAAKLTGNPAALVRVIQRLPAQKLPEALAAHPTPHTRIKKLHSREQRRTVSSGAQE